MKSTQLGIGFKLLVLIICMTSFGAWFLQPLSSPLFSMMFSGLMVIGFINNRNCFSFSKVMPSWFILLVIAIILTCTGMNLNGYIIALIGILPTFFIFALKVEFKEDLLHFIKKSLGIMILISFPFYFFFLVGGQLPHFELVRETIDGTSDFQYTVYYLFTIKHDGDILAMLLPRYEFVFYEPGYFGCLMAVLLFLNGFRFDRNHWEDYVFVVALVLSMSLAGVIIGLFGFVAYLIKNSQHKLLWLLTSITFIGVFYLVVVNYNNGNNLINNAFFTRFEYNDATGTISGNSRFSGDVKEFFWGKFVQSEDFLFGMRNSEKVLTGNNVDYLSFIIRHGLVAFLALFLFFFLPVFRDRNNRYNLFCLSFLYLLMFSQGSISIFWAMNLYVFILGVNHCIRYDENRIVLSKM